MSITLIHEESETDKIIIVGDDYRTCVDRICKARNVNSEIELSHPFTMLYSQKLPLFLQSYFEEYSQLREAQCSVMGERVLLQH